MQLPGRGLYHRHHRRPAGGAAADVADSAAETLQCRRHFWACRRRHISASGWPTPAFGLPFAIYLLAELHRRPAARPDRDRRTSTAPTISRSSAASFCRCRSRRSLRSRSSSSSGCGTTCWSPWCSSAPRTTRLVLTGQPQCAARLARRQLGNPHRFRLHLHHRAADRVLRAAALLRARSARRLRQGRLNHGRHSASPTSTSPMAPCTS